MRRTLIRLAALSAISVVGVVGLVACGSDDDTPVAQSTWHVTNVYVDEEHPSVLPDSIAGKATMVFGESTIAGFSGCAPFRARADFSKDDASASPLDATKVNFTRVNIDAPADCSGPELYYHDNLTGMLDGSFDIERKAPNELLLVKHTEDFNRPAIRLSSVTNGS